jgi:putative Ca2+/H+ antiporter (TMEM165/GDT1 family)
MNHNAMGKFFFVTVMTLIGVMIGLTVSLVLPQKFVAHCMLAGALLFFFISRNVWEQQHESR